MAVEAELARLRAENARLLKLLKLTPQQAAPPGPAQGAFFEAAPGIVHHRSPQDAKVAFFGALFAAARSAQSSRGRATCRHSTATYTFYRPWTNSPDWRDHRWVRFWPA